MAEPWFHMWNVETAPSFRKRFTKSFSALSGMMRIARAAAMALHRSVSGRVFQKWLFKNSLRSFWPLSFAIPRLWRRRTALSPHQ
jgi:hypothetical protein